MNLINKIRRSSTNYLNKLTTSIHFFIIGILFNNNNNSNSIFYYITKQILSIFSDNLKKLTKLIIMDRERAGSGGGQPEHRQQRAVIQQIQQIADDPRELGELVQAVGNEIDAFLEEAEAFMQGLDDGNDDAADDLSDDEHMQEQAIFELMEMDESDMDEEDEDEGSSSSSSDDDDVDDDMNENDIQIILPTNNNNKTIASTSRSHKSSIYCCRPLQIEKCVYSSTGAVPCARSGHRIIADEANLYSLGGYNPNYNPETLRNLRQCWLFQELWRYNFATKSWHLLMNGDTNMPTELASNALVMHNNKLISHGGTGYPFGEVCSNDCYVYTTGSQPTVSCLKVTGELPTAQYGPGIVIHEHYLYTIGGTTGFDYSCDVYRLNLKTRVWERVYISRPEMREDPEGRYRHEVVYDGQHIYVLGGGTSLSVYDLQCLPAFNLKANRWDYFDTLPDRSVLKPNSSPKEGYPLPRKCFSCVQHKNNQGDVEAFITGGLQVVLENRGEADLRNYFGDIWRLNMRTKQWSLIRQAALPKPLYFHSAAHSGNGCMWIFGGIEYSLKDNHRRNYMFKMWMTVPKLSEMCWEAVTYYNDRLNAYDRSALLATGLPDSFVQRIAALKDKPRQNVFHHNSTLSQNNNQQNTPATAAAIL